jgi:hypothetical protein
MHAVWPVEVVESFPIAQSGSVWNRIPDVRRDDLIEFALEHEALSTRELAVKYTDEKRYFVSESSAYRILKEADLMTDADEFKDKTTAINQMWQTDFTYFKIIGWGWYYLPTILDDHGRQPQKFSMRINTSHICAQPEQLKHLTPPSAGKSPASHHPNSFDASVACP